MRVSHIHSRITPMYPVAVKLMALMIQGTYVFTVEDNKKLLFSNVNDAFLNVTFTHHNTRIMITLQFSYTIHKHYACASYKKWFLHTYTPVSAARTWMSASGAISKSLRTL